VLTLALKNCAKSFNLINVIGAHQSTKFSVSAFKNNNFFSWTTKSSTNLTDEKCARFADEFIKLSSIRYKPEKLYTKHCPDFKPVCEYCQSSDSTPKCPYISDDQQSTS